MARFSHMMLAWLLLLPVVSSAQDATNVWFSNGPTGQLIVQSVVVNPSFPDTLFAGTVGGTVARSLNRGGTWTTVGASIADSILALAIARNQTQVIYAGTLHSGVYKSSNHGTTWAAAGLAGVQVGALAVDPNDTNRVYAGTRDSLMQTTNGGVSWTKANLDSVRVTTIAMHPLRPDTVFVGTDGRGMFRTLNDAATWTAINSGVSSNRVSRLEIHPTQPDTIYAATNDAGMFRSTDGGAVWSNISNGLTTNAMTSLAISPTEPNVVFAGASTGQVFKTADNGGIWTDITRNLPIGTLVLSLAVAPDSANVVYAGIGPVLSVGVQRLKQVGLGTVTSVVTGQAPDQIVAADLNGDGDRDLVVSNGNENFVSAFLVSSQGAVLTRTDFRTGSGPAQVRVADLDGDGDRDLVVANRVKLTLSVLINDSTGVFSAPSDLFVGGPISTVVLADLDGDGDVDIATANGNAGTVLVFRNDGKGSFEAPEITSAIIGVSDLVATDFSGDGIPDLVVLSQSQNRLVLMTNNGNATFSVDEGSAIGSRPGHVAAADLDVDGDIDLAVTTADARVDIYFNSGGFDRSKSVSYALSDTASAIVVADFDLDRYPDLLLPRGTGFVSALINDGNGAFGTPLSFGTIASAGGAVAIDVNSDGQLDIAVTSPNSGVLTVFANGVATSIKLPAPPQNVVAADAQGDLGGNAKLTWRRPRVDELTGRANAYRIFRALSKSGTFAQIARVDTTSAKAMDSTFVFRSFVDSNATVGVPYYYYLKTENNGGTLSSSSDTVTTTTRAQPFFDISFSGNSPYHVRDTVDVSVRLNLLGHDIQSFSLLMGIDTASVSLLDRDAATSGIQPFLVDPTLASEARVLQNRLDPLNLTHIDFGLGFLPELADSLPISVGTLRLVGKRDTTTLIRILNDTSAARQTALTSRDDGALIRPFIPSASQLVFKNHRIRGTVVFQGRTENLAVPINLYLTQTNRTGTALTTPYVGPNDADLNRNGVQLTLSKTGTFELQQVAVGRYGLFAKSYQYLRGRISTDSLTVTATAGGPSNVAFKFVSADSVLNVLQLRAGDSNNDNRIDLADFGLLAAHFGESGFATGSAAWGTDFNGDGVVNLADFALLQSNFGEIGMGSAIVAKPVVVASELYLNEKQLMITKAQDVVGISVDVIGEGVVGDLALGHFWQDATPMIVTRKIKQGYRVAAVLKQQAQGMSGDGVVFDLPGLLENTHLEQVRLFLADGSLVWAYGAQLPLQDNVLPTKPELAQNFPNPFNPSTTIPFAVSEPTHVVLTVYSPLGQAVRTLVRDVLEPGHHQIVWDGRDDAGRLVASGLYFIQFVQGDYVAVRKALFIK